MLVVVGHRTPTLLEGDTPACHPGVALRRLDYVEVIVGLEGVRSELAFVQTPGGNARLELIRLLRPRSRPAEKIG